MEKERLLAIGVAYIGHGLYPGNGVSATDLMKVDRVFKDTVQFDFKEKTATPFNEEYTDDPYHVMYLKKDADGFQFAIPSPTAEEKILFMGGMITEDGEWAEPINTPAINRSFVVRTKPYKGKQRQYRFVNCSVSAYTSQAPGAEKEELLLVKVTKQTAKTMEGVKKPAYFVGDIDAIDDVDGEPVTAVAITGVPKVGTVLTATLTPVAATGTYQWQKKTGSGQPSDIAAATNATYTPVAGDVGAKVIVKFMATGNYIGSATSAETVAVVA